MRIFAPVLLALAVLVLLPLAQAAPTPPQEQQQSFGAIAFDPLHAAAGISHAFGSRAEAEKEAMGQCTPQAQDCEIAVWFENRCGAVAADYAIQGPSEYWALGVREADADAAALKKCTAGKGRQCKIVVTQCSYR